MEKQYENFFFKKISKPIIILLNENEIQIYINGLKYQKNNTLMDLKIRSIVTIPIKPIAKHVARL